MIESPKNFIEQFQNFIEHIAGVMKTFLTKEIADNYYLSFTAQKLTEAQKTQARTNIDAISLRDVPSILSMYPVGSIYMSADANFNPNKSWGGTWVKIENRFLLGSGTKAVGATGGEENVTLSTNQIPSHNHSGRGNIDITGEFWFDRTNGSQVTLDGASGAFYGTRWTSGYVKAAGNNGSGNTGMAFSASRNWSGSIPSAGGGQAHNNMPPYQVVNVWRRTA